MLAPVLIVIVIGPGANACPAGSCADDPLVTAFQQAARRVLGSEADLEFESAISDPPDAESAAKATNADGVVELTVSSADNKARVHCYVSKDQRWVDREISFGDSHGSPQRELVERGRLLGFAVASMFSADATPREAAPAPAPAPAPASAPAPPLNPPKPEPTAPRTDSGPPAAESRMEPSRSSIEFAGIVSSGLRGTAGGLGASGALRFAWTGPLWARLFVAARSGNVPLAQASTRTAQLGAGMAVALLPATQRFELGARFDAFANYFDASHLSEDDIIPDRRSRWLPGADLLAEGGVRISGSAGLMAAVGIEALAGKTEIYTHGDRVAVVPPFRAVAELGFRARF
ncbi:MAG: hypothetical protein ABUL60_13065 [Myxococcales bacterium]